MGAVLGVGEGGGDVVAGQLLRPTPALPRLREADLLEARNVQQLQGGTMNRRLPHTPATSARTGGDDRPAGACRFDPYWFDQAAGEARAGRDLDYAITQARAICATCPLTGADGPCVRDNPNAPGVVGGYTRQERNGLARLKPCGTVAAYDRHKRRGEEPCFPCRQASAAHTAAKRARKGSAA